MRKFLTILFILFICSRNVNATHYYVSAAGSDGAAGTSTGAAWATISKVNSSSFSAGDTISFRSGDSFIGPLIPPNSGTSGSRIVFDTYNGSTKAIITGEASVSSFTNISGNLWVSNSAVSTLSTLNVVTIGGSFVRVGKSPNTGFWNVDSHSGATSITSTSIVTDWTGGTVVYRAQHWIYDKSKITSRSSTTINFSDPGTTYAPQTNWGFFIQNDSLACDTQNEWWYNPSKKLGIYSSGAPSTAIVATVDTLVKVNAINYLTFHNLQFQYSNTACFSLSSGHDVKVIACDFIYNGMWGLVTQSAVHHVTIDSCTADYTMDDFVYGGASKNWTITNNTIRRTAQWAGMGHEGGGHYIALGNIGDTSLLQYNNIFQTGYVPIDFRGNSHTIQYNLIDTFCNILDDGGGIYTFTGGTPQTWGQRTVKNCIVMNGGGAYDGTPAATLTPPHSDAYGLYMDDNSSQVTLDSNTVYNCGSAGIFLHGNHNIDVLHCNVYRGMNSIPSTFGQIYIQEDTVNYQKTRSLTVKKNVFVADTVGGIQYEATFTTNLDDLNLFGTFDSNYYWRPINDAGNRIAMVKSSGNVTGQLSNWQTVSGQESHSLIPSKTISSKDSIRFYYNATQSTVAVGLGGKWQDMAGTVYNGTVNIPPYYSIILVFNSPLTTNKGFFWRIK